jgi:hypothetical protein
VETSGGRRDNAEISRYAEEFLPTAAVNPPSSDKASPQFAFRLAVRAVCPFVMPSSASLQTPRIRRWIVASPLTSAGTDCDAIIFTP